MAKIEIFPLCIGYSGATLWVKNSLEIALSLTVFEIFTLFHFLQNSKMAAKCGENWNFSPCIGYSRTLWVKNSLKIALSLTVFKIFTIFHFLLKSKMAAKCGENWNFSPLHRILSYPVGQKFTQNRSISYSFQDIHTFSFSAKIQDGRQKFARNLLPFPRYFQCFIFRWNPRWLPKVAKIEIFPLGTGYS